MKKVIVAFCVLCSMPLHAQHVEAVNDVIDVGQVHFRSPVSTDFELKNNGNHTFRIEKVKTSCGCTSVDYPKGMIAANSNFTVKVTYDAKQLGHFEKPVGIYLPHQKEPVVLTLKGVVVEEVTDFKGDFPYKLGELLTDREDIEFDDVNRGDRPFAKIHVMNPTSTTVQPVVMHMPNYLKADMSPSKLRQGQSGELTITLKSAELRNYGLTQTSVYLGKIPGDKVAPNKEISISAILLPNFNDLEEEDLEDAPVMTISETTLDLGSFNGKKKLKGEIIIGNEGQSTLDISALQMFVTGLQVSLNKQKIEPGETAKLRITAMSGLLKNTKSKPRVLMITNDPEQPKVVINIEVKP